MPYRCEKLKISGTQFDRRQKLSDEVKDEIRRLYPQVQSQRKLAEMFDVSRRLVSFILDPQKEEVNRERNKQRRKRGCYKVSPKKWADTMREHRRYKQGLYLRGEIEF